MGFHSMGLYRSSQTVYQVHSYRLLPSQILPIPEEIKKVSFLGLDGIQLKANTQSSSHRILTPTPETLTRFEKNWAVLHFEGSSEFFLFKRQKGGSFKGRG